MGGLWCHAYRLLCSPSLVVWGEMTQEHHWPVFIVFRAFNSSVEQVLYCIDNTRDYDIVGQMVSSHRKESLKHSFATRPWGRDTPHTLRRGGVIAL